MTTACMFGTVSQVIFVTIRVKTCFSESKLALKSEKKNIRKHTLITYPYNIGLIFLRCIFFYFAQNTDYGYTLEPPRRGGSNEYPQATFWSIRWVKTL